MSTICFPEHPSPVADAEALRKACQGWGTDEKAVISILGRRNATQRKLIRQAYEDLYQEDLVKRLESELSGDFEKAVLLWTYDPAERDARLANEALKSRKKSIIQLQVIVEIACASSPHHLVAVRQAYCSLFNCSLEEDIISNVSPPVQKILVSLVSSYRYDKELVDYDIANEEATIMRKPIEAKKLDDDEVVRVLSTRNMFQLRQTFLCYKNNYGKSIDQEIMACGKGILESVMKVVVWCIDYPEKHFAEVIKAAIVGFGTDEDSLTRAIVCRAEIDLMNVRAEYFNTNKSSMDNAIIDDTSGDYKDFLMTLLGANI
ncbi:Annexin D3 [Sesamum angolense]|uniref:Annexin n=1 Tax=Sesamum angolense TaxID=2727404 RepID=A0AAE1XGQ6_9LAMI|nr:Annexin D3 [Sesamum angolense]